MVLDAISRRVRRSGDNPALYNNGGGAWGWPFSAGIGSWRTDTWRNPNRVGPAVTDASALSLTAFYRGVSLIAGTVAGMPLQVFQEEIDAKGIQGGTTKIKSAETAYLWGQPNREMIPQAFWERIVADEVRGNAFIFVVKNARGDVVQQADVQPLEDWGIWYVERWRVRVGRLEETVGEFPVGTKVYWVDGETPMLDFSIGGEMVHIPNWGDGLVGYDPIKIAAQALSLGLSAEQYAARFFSQGGGPDGLITTDQTLTPEQAKELVKVWQEQHAGTAKAHGIGFLGNGAKYQQTSVDADKAQLYQLRSFQVQEVARLLGIPPYLLADVDHASQGGGNGVEEFNRSLYTYTLAAHVKRIEQTISYELLKRNKTNRYVKLNPNDFLRGNTLQRYQAYRLATFMTEDEKRGLEDMEPMGGAAGELLSMTNMAPLDDLEQIAMNAGGGSPSGGGNDPTNPA